MDPSSRSGRLELTIALVRMSRPDHLLLVAAVFLSGAAMAVARGASWEAARVATGLVAALVVAVSIHVANEFADRDTDALTTRTWFSGGSGATADTDLSESTLAIATAASMALAAMVVVGLAAAGATSGWVTALLAVAAVFGWQYSLPPWALARRGWGEVDNAVLGGAVLPLAGVATLMSPTVDTLLAVVPATLAVFANLLATQWPDRWADAAVGAYSLATRWTPARLAVVHGLALLGAVTLPWLLPERVMPSSVAGATALSIPFALWAVARFTRDDQPLPTVAAMLVLVVGSGVAWGVLAVGAPAR